MMYILDSLLYTSLIHQKKFWIVDDYYIVSTDGSIILVDATRSFNFYI